MKEPNTKPDDASCGSCDKPEDEGYILNHYSIYDLDPPEEDYGHFNDMGIEFEFPEEFGKTSPTDASNVESLTFHWTPSQVDGYDESSITAYRWDGESWYLLPNQAVNVDANRLTITEIERSGPTAQDGIWVPDLRIGLFAMEGSGDEGGGGDGGGEKDDTPLEVWFEDPTTNGSAYQDYIEANAYATDASGIDKVFVRLYSYYGILLDLETCDNSPCFQNWTGLPYGDYYLNSSARDDHHNYSYSETIFIRLMEPEQNQTENQTEEIPQQPEKPPTNPQVEPEETGGAEPETGGGILTNQTNITEVNMEGTGTAQPEPPQEQTGAAQGNQEPGMSPLVVPLILLLILGAVFGLFYARERIMKNR